MWHLYNLISEGDAVRAPAVRYDLSLLKINLVHGLSVGECKLCLPLDPPSHIEYA